MHSGKERNMEKHVRIGLAHIESNIDDLMEVRAMTIGTADNPKEVEEYIDKFIENKLEEYKDIYKDMSVSNILFKALDRIGVKVQEDGKAETD